MKRFTDTNKWRDPWFRKLSGPAKAVWQYVCDNCDPVGIVEIDYELLSIDCGHIVTPEHLKELGDRLEAIPGGRYILPKFINFQYGELTPTCPPHRTPLKLIAVHGLIKVGVAYHYPTNPPYPKPRVSLPLRKRNGKEMEEEKEKEGDKSLREGETNGEVPRGTWQPSPIQKRLNALFSRRDTTEWSDKEKKAFKELTIEDSDMVAVEAYYSAPWPHDKDHRRRDLMTLLNNFLGEVDRARKFRPAPKHQKIMESERDWDRILKEGV